MELMFAPMVPHVWSGLEAARRAGWLKRGIDDGETVAQHTKSMLAIASEEQSHMPEYVGLRYLDLRAMCEVHDFPEWKGTDEIALTTDSARERQDRYVRERAAMEELCAELGHKGRHMFGVWYRFTKSQDEVAKFARALDKYQAIEKAFYYERTLGIEGLGAEFLQYSPPIEHPVLKRRFQEKCVL